MKLGSFLLISCFFSFCLGTNVVDGVVAVVEKEVLLKSDVLQQTYAFASQKNIDVAVYHAKKNNLKINYLYSSPEKINLNKKFDVILNMEIVEHVDNLNLFLKKSTLLLKKNGLMFIATLNKTLKSYVFGIIGAEYILKWLPIGTHDWNKFVQPEELINIARKNNLELKKIDGMSFNILKNEWLISKDKSVNYITQFKKI